MTNVQIARLLHEPRPLRRDINTKIPTPAQPLSLGRDIITKIPTSAQPLSLGRDINTTIPPPARPPPLGRDTNTKVPTPVQPPPLGRDISTKDRNLSNHYGACVWVSYPHQQMARCLGTKHARGHCPDRHHQSLGWRAQRPVHPGR